jgi:glycosyltransferase involved in cell wall biosynthesis
VRIVHVIADLGSGGAERMVLLLAADATERGDTVAIAAEEGTWTADIAGAGASWIPLPLLERSTTATLRSAVRLAPELRRFRPDIVHAHNVRATAAARAAVALSARRTTILTTVHGLAPSDYPGAARILRPLTKRVVACAPAVARSLADAGYPRSRIDVITNGAALEAADDARVKAMRRHLGVGDGAVVVGVGRLAEQKDWPALVRAAGGFPPCDTLVAGEGPLGEELAGLAAEHGSRVRFVGRVEDMSAFLALADCLVSTSTWEGLPLSLLEALSLGVPSVVTAVDGVTDLVPEEAAVLIPPGDPGALVAGVTRVLGDPAFAAGLREAARRCAARWSPRRMLDEYRHAYRAAADGAARWVEDQTAEPRPN